MLRENQTTQFHGLSRGGDIIITRFEYENVWKHVKRAARTTIWKEDDCVEPSDSWKKKILLAEHSPIRKIKFSWKWDAIKYWVSVHFVRHKYGIEHWVSTQRSDRTGIDRDISPQSSLVSHECEANAQALINVSRKRLCSKASKETRDAWIEVKNAIEKSDPILSSVMVPECIYRGFCPEFKSCGYSNTLEFKEKLEKYRRTE